MEPPTPSHPILAFLPDFALEQTLAGLLHGARIPDPTWTAATIQCTRDILASFPHHILVRGFTHFIDVLHTTIQLDKALYLRNALLRGSEQRVLGTVDAYEEEYRPEWWDWKPMLRDLIQTLSKEVLVSYLVFDMRIYDRVEESLKGQIRG